MVQPGVCGWVPFEKTRLKRGGLSSTRHGPGSVPRDVLVVPLFRKQTLPEFMNFKLFGKTILVVNLKFRLFLGHPLRQ